MRANRLLVTDTQRQVAAARRVLPAGQRQRYASSMTDLNFTTQNTS